LREFVIERVLGDGGFGVVYSALDLRLERRVAIKEYMPSSLATRCTDYSVQMLTSKRHRDAFEVGLRSFINEARLLARFEHPSLIKVHQFWQEKGTAYMVMPFYSAPTLRTWVRNRNEPVGEAWLRTFLLGAMDALDVLHAESCLHRDIAPDNILVLKDSTPLLLDFGAARRVIGDLRKALTVIVKPGFAPLEQYADTVKMKQGPWTDVYALAAVAHFVLTGQAPAPAVSRVLADEVVPLRHRLQGKYSDALLGAIDTALAVKPERRPQTLGAFRSLLLSDRPDEWAPTRLIRRAAVGSTTHDSIVMATDAVRVPTAPVVKTVPQTAALKSVQRTTAPVTLGAKTAAPATLTREATAVRQRPARFAASFADVATLGQAIRNSIPDSVTHSRWLGVAGYAAALVAFGGVLALTSYLVESYADANSKYVTMAPAVAQKPEAAPQPQPRAELQPKAPPVTVDVTATRLSGTEAMVEARPTEVTLAPAKIDLRKPAPPAHPAPVAAAPAAKPKAAPQAKVSTVERNHNTGTAALLLTAARPAPAAANPARKTRGLDELVVPLERGAEIAHVAPVELVVASPPEPMPLRVIERPQPQFPASAAKDGVHSGRVLAQLTVNSDGSVGRIDIVDAEPRNVFEREVRRTLSNWSYEAPGQPRQTSVEIRFKLEQ
jgi:TonB family protein